ncbi:hypothetical protein BBAD15_g7097 [Beauveria bassiana D1-5]|uniref:Uncharacterized protein n=1 Tax=Beauveria bassiana D1-5 TaxID=1245745 RepID=A0A0A2VI59_BEABA|nr:hypothetical protein BBAD15_g7097 [Beauveria bassiana D1-5]
MGHRNHRALVKLVPQNPLHSGVHLLVEAVVVSSGSTPPRAIDSSAAARGTVTPSSSPRQAHGHCFRSQPSPRDRYGAAPPGCCRRRAGLRAVFSDNNLSWYCGQVISIDINESVVNLKQPRKRSHKRALTTVHAHD